MMPDFCSGDKSVVVIIYLQMLTKPVTFPNMPNALGSHPVSLQPN